MRERLLARVQALKVATYDGDGKGSHDELDAEDVAVIVDAILAELRTPDEAMIEAVAIAIGDASSASVAYQAEVSLTAMVDALK